MISVHFKKLRKRADISAEEERAIRKDPLGQASSLIQKVFSSLQ